MNLGTSISTIVASNPNASVRLITDMTSLHAAVAGETHVRLVYLDVLFSA